MNCSMIKSFLDSTFQNYFKCKQVGEYLAISTPFYYPDGDIIEVFVHSRTNKIVLSDMGETMRYLGSYDLDIKSYSKRQLIIDDVTHMFNIKFLKGVLYTPINSIDTLAEHIFNLSQCIIRICDLLYTIRGSSPIAFVEEVKDFLDFNKFKFEENYPVETKSDNRYEFEFGVEIEDCIKLIKVMTPPSKPSQTPNIERVLRIWFDIANFSDFQMKSRITLLDDTNYHWKEKSIILLKQLSVVTYWTNREGFLNELKSKIA